jgi:uroporphyrinogen decarboxylase
MSQMTSRERVLRAFAHQEADRLPFDIGSLTTTTMHIDAHNNFKKHLGFQGGETSWCQFYNQTVEIDQRIIDRYESDCIGLNLDWPDSLNFKVLNESDGSQWFVDDWGLKYRRPAGGLYYDVVDRPLCGATFEDIDRYPWPDPDDPGRWVRVEKRARDLFENTDKCIVLNSSLNSQIITISAFLTGYKDHFINLIQNPKISQAIADKITNFHIRLWNNLLDRVGNYIQVVSVADDLGFQNGPAMKPDLYRSVYKPYHKKLANFIKSKSDVKISYHCCGSIYELIPDLIDIGFDSLNPIQVSCKNMGDTAKIKKEFGDKLTFWGAGCDSQNTLPFGTIEDIRTEVKKRVDEMAYGGGMILAPIHNIQADIPVEKIDALYSACMEYARDAYIKNN